MTTEQRMASAAAEIKAIVEQAQADIARAWTRFTAGLEET